MKALNGKLIKLLLSLFLVMNTVKTLQSIYPEKVVPLIDDMMEMWANNYPKPAYIIRAEYFAAPGTSSLLYIIKQGIKLSPVQVFISL